MMKRGLCVVLALVLLLSGTVVLAEPSNWAVNFIEKANSAQLIPEHLNNAYQNNIKRYEYVQLALKVLEKNDVAFSQNNLNPFSDIDGLSYRDDIIKAYHLGIISGYSDGTFRPEAEISREEVSALVYNLIKKINGYTTLSTTEVWFSDSTQISSWAKPFVAFSYNNQILSGTGINGGLVTMDPQGKTTREQAITLLYKVYSNDVLLGRRVYEHPIALTLDVDATALNITADHLGKDVMDVCLEIIKKDHVDLSYMSDTFINISHHDQLSIEVIREQTYKQTVIHLVDLYDNEIYEDYNTISVALFGDDLYQKKVYQLLNDFRSKKKVKDELILVGDYEIFFEKTDDLMISVTKK